MISFVASNLGSVIKLSEKIFSLTYGVTARAAFGEKCQEQETVIAAVKERIEATGRFDVADVFTFIKLLQVISGMGPKLKKIHKRIERVLGSLVNKHKASQRTNGKGRVNDLEHIRVIS